MSENFVRPNRNLEARIAQINDPLDLVNMLKEIPMPSAQQSSAASMPAMPNRDDFSQTAHRTIYPYGNLRLEISGVSEESLDGIEERIRQAFER